MYLLHNGIEYRFNKEESDKAVETCVKVLENLMQQCHDKNCETFYLIILVAMKALCESQLESFGNEGIEALFANRIYLDAATNE